MLKVNNNVLGNDLEVVTSGNANTDDLFRFDQGVGQYIYNLSTKNTAFTKGAWVLTIDFENPNIPDRQFTISLKP